jgi:hypothetical protein
LGASTHVERMHGWNCGADGTVRHIVGIEHAKGGAAGDQARSPLQGETGMTCRGMFATRLSKSRRSSSPDNPED